MKATAYEYALRYDIGSASFSVANATTTATSRASKSWTGLTIHRSLESFAAVDLPLRSVVAPKLHDRGSRCIDASASCPGEPRHRVETRPVRLQQPSLGLACPVAAHHSQKPQAAHRSEVGPIALSARRPSPPEHLPAIRAARAQRCGDDRRDRPRYPIAGLRRLWRRPRAAVRFGLRHCASDRWRCDTPTVSPRA